MLNSLNMIFLLQFGGERKRRKVAFGEGLDLER